MGTFLVGDDQAADEEGCRVSSTLAQLLGPKPQRAQAN